MWKKIGSIGPGSNSDISSRSRDQNAYQPFSQLSKMRINESQFFPQTNEVFTTNFLTKRKNVSNKWNSQSKLMTNPQLYQSQSFHQINQQHNPISLTTKNLSKKGSINININNTKLKSSLKLIPNSNRNYSVIHEDKAIIDAQSTDIFGSDTSLDEHTGKKLHHYRSTPQLNFFNQILIQQQNINSRKIQAKNKLKSLKKEHTQFKKDVQNQFKLFKKSLTSMETQMMTQLQQFLSKFNTKPQSLPNQTQNNLNPQSLSVQANIYNGAQKFTNQIKDLSRKKSQMINKLNSLRSK